MPEPSNTVRISARLPRSARTNGLNDFTDSILENPTRTLVAVVHLQGDTISEDVDTGVRTPTLGIYRIEVLGGVEDVPDEVQQMIATRYERRTGNKPLPFHVIDPEVGEVTQS